MTISDRDRIWMNRALALARNGIGLTSPNPAVGCVIVDRNGELAGEGWHEYDLRDHAEVAALRTAGSRARGATAYVTLEPCNHTGRTGPCTQALINAGVSRVVAATIDPNIAVSGGGCSALRSAGIWTSVGLCEQEARRLNEPFARWCKSHRPFVLMKAGMSLDGRIAPPPAQRTAREPFWITGEESRAAVQLLRWQSDAILTGIDTVLADDPQLTDRSNRPRRRPLLRVVLDSSLRIPLDSKLVQSANNDLLVFTVSTADEKLCALTSRGVRVEVVPAENNRVPLERVLDRLGAESILSVLTETGSRLNAALLAANLVDRIQLFVSPQILGADAVSAFASLPATAQLGPLEVEHHGNDLSLTALLRDPWQNS
jgi:diaminohydroxyphosphoribosylaminopyrimidine deaminase/5-amino-6-(5-phosphoribosylamino)uracil reductase